MGTSSEALAPVLSEFARCGTDMRFLEDLSCRSAEGGMRRSECSFSNCRIELCSLCFCCLTVSVMFLSATLSGTDVAQGILVLKVELALLKVGGQS